MTNLRSNHTIFLKDRVCFHDCVLLLVEVTCVSASARNEYFYFIPTSQDSHVSLFNVKSLCNKISIQQ